MSVRILHGDCRDVLKTLPSASVQCCVTSPPYFGLRDYGVDGQIGLEQSPDAYIAELVAVFREVRRVLRDDGVLFLNLGDSYNSIGGGYNESGSRGVTAAVCAATQAAVLKGRNRGGYSGLKPKDLIGIPWMAAFALRADGWWLRRDIIWSKPNPMPESVTDRPTSAHEYVFLLTKSARYFWDAEAVREPCESGPSDLRKMAEGKPRIGGKHVVLEDALSKASAATNIGQKRSVGSGDGRNLRSVWTIATSPLPEAHFATFPPDLAERCILAGTSEKGCCSVCGTPWARITTKGEPDMAHRAASGADASGGYNGQSIKGHDSHGVQNASDVKRRILEGMREKAYSWEPGCSCGLKAQSPIPCLVLDPFGGAGTTGLVADRMGRDAILIELNPEYAAMGKRRVERDAGLFAEIATS